MAENLNVARLLDDIADIYEMKEVRFKPRAYRRAAQTIRSLGEPVEDIRDRGELEGIPGIGRNIAAKIVEYLDTGRIEKHEELKKELPVDIDELTSIEGLGPKKVMKLYQELGIRSLEDLKEAAEEGRIAGIEGFGEKTEKTILENIEFAKNARDRFLLGYAIFESDRLISALGDHCSRLEVAGSLRRKRETVGDIDILAVSEDPGKVMELFVSMEQVQKVIARGKKKSSVRLDSGINVDLRLIEDESYGSALQYFTGSKQHNVHLRTIARKGGMKLSEYGLFKGDKLVAGRNEEEVYRGMGLDWIPPEMREDNGEIELAADGGLPDLVGIEDIRCDLQMHSTWSDGKDTLHDMASRCRELGYEYAVITDHVGEIRVANALDLNRIRKQKKEIARIEDELDFRIIQGVEANIRKDGSLDVEKELMEEAEIVLAAVHSAFRMDRKEMTERLVNAVSSGDLHILAHPLGRKIQERKPIDVDLDRVLEAASDAGTIMEVNAFPERLDLNGYNVKRALDAGVRLSIGTDAHMREHLGYIQLGVSTARRGWATADDIMNTRSEKELLRALGK